MNASPTRALRDEHALILEVLDRFEHALARAARTAEPAAHEFASFIEFFRGYADCCHHRKEEACLFPLLERHGVVGPLGCMLEEHREGRGLIARLARAVEAADFADIEAAGYAYADLLRIHIEKENRVLFELADQCLTAAETAELARLYAQLESDPDYGETWQRCCRLVESMLAAAGRGAARGSA
ncbi:MAG TPA: hemerythrin domain-containing protein [Gammaproteobacteria bacterium]|nr:hemerythrin domain-containing protein [Gammaproteobacteria bacterium]